MGVSYASVVRTFSQVLEHFLQFCYYLLIQLEILKILKMFTCTAVILKCKFKIFLFGKKHTVLLAEVFSHTQNS